MDDFEAIERQLDRLEGKALLQGCTEATEREIAELCARLNAIEEGAGEDWIMARDKELGRPFKPIDPPAAPRDGRL